MKGPIILARNIDCKSILQKTLEQFGLAASKYRQNWDSRAIFSAPHFADEFAGPAISREMFLQSAFQLGFLPSKPCLFPLKSGLEFVLYRGKPNLLVCQSNSLLINQKFSFVLQLACVEDVWKGRERELFRHERNARWARGRREGNACKETIVFLNFNIRQANVKILIGQSSKHVNHSLDTLIRLVEINITLLSN